MQYIFLLADFSPIDILSTGILQNDMMPTKNIKYFK